MDMSAATFTFDPRSPAFRANPYAHYDLLRERTPVLYWEAWGIWFLSRYDDCNALLRDPRLGHAEQQGEPPVEQRALVEQHLEQPLAPFFRPPFGVWNDDTRRAALASGYPYIVTWSVDSGDWEGTEPPAIERLLANLSCVQPGDIILMHANRQRSAELLPVLVAQLRAKGLEPVTLGTLLASGEPVIMQHPTDVEHVRYCAASQGQGQP